MALVAGDRLGRYEILAPLGAGGMGEVYRARDSVLDREVAVKVLPEGVADDPDRLQRFEREARAVAKLSHSNILEIFDFGREGDVSFAVAELLEGETLRDRLGSEQLGWREAAKIGAEIADGLVAAHDRGVVHRDLKPANIFLSSDGRVKILDFGLARLTAKVDTEGRTEALDSTLTSEGAVVGTLGYMSPEQVRGREADHRSDVFSLGCVLYEMVGGRRAFEGDSGADTMAAILTAEPERLSSLGVDAPLDLELAIQRCLEKSPDDRFQSAADLAFVLRASVTDTDAVRVDPPAKPRTRWLVPAAVAAVVAVIAIGLWSLLGGRLISRPEQSAAFEANRVVVAEFENRIGDPSLDDFGLHVADSITALLRQVSGLTVATNPFRSGALGADADPLRRLAESTRSGLVVTGICYARGDQLEIRASIVDPWQEEVRQSFEAVRALRSGPSSAVEALSQLVAGTLGFHFASRIPLGSLPPVPMAAFQEYAGAMEHWHTDRETEFSRLRRALEIEPAFHQARVHLFWEYATVGRYDEAEAELELLESQESTMTPYGRAIVRAARARLEGRPLDVLRAVREAAVLAPESDRLRLQTGVWANATNRPLEAIAALSQLDFDWSTGSSELASMPFSQLCLALHMAGDYEAQLSLAKQSLEHFPDDMIFYGMQAAALAAMGRFEELNNIVQQSFAIPGSLQTAGDSHTYTVRELRAHGYREQSLELAEQVLGWYHERADELQPFPWNYVLALNAAERWEEARRITEQLVRDHPKWDSALGLLGVLEARVGNTDEARRIAEQLEAKGDKDSLAERMFLLSERSYWRACISAQLGRPDEAVRLLQRSFSEGYRAYANLHIDINLEPLWDYPPFQELIRPKG
jgi:tetratricopeptide (TPR) repeat protein